MKVTYKTQDGWLGTHNWGEQVSIFLRPTGISIYQPNDQYSSVKTQRSVIKKIEFTFIKGPYHETR